MDVGGDQCRALQHPSVYDSASEWNALKRSLCVCHDALESILSSASPELGDSRKGLNEDLGGPSDPSIAVNELRTRVAFQLKEAERICSRMSQLCKADPIRAAQLERLDDLNTGYSIRARQICTNLAERIERQRLLASFSAGDSSTTDTAPDEQGQLLREKSSIHTAVTLLDQTITQGRDAVASLARQRNVLNNFKAKVSGYTQSFSRIRSVMSRIRRTRLKHSLVLAFVVGVCLLFTLWSSVG